MQMARACSSWAATCLLALSACAAPRSASVPATAAAANRRAAEESFRKGQEQAAPRSSPSINGASHENRPHKRRFLG
jgi:hypothetical protein